MTCGTHEKPIKSSFEFWLFLAALGVALLSPLGPFSKDMPAADSTVFLSIGQGILDGKVPYVDFFDHKGPLLYAINAGGLLLGKFLGLSCGFLPWGGVWILELVSLFLALLFAFKTALLFAAPRPAMLAVLVNSVCLGAFFYQGNLPEEYALPLVFASLYLYLRHFISGVELRGRDTVLLGVFAGMSLLLKPNMFSVWAACSGVLCLQMALARDWRRFALHVGSFFSGVALVFVPVFLLLAITGALPDFFGQYVLFNLRYASHSGSLWNSIHNFFSIANRMHIWVLPVVAFYLVARFHGKRECPGFLAWFLSIPLAMAMFASSPHLGERNFMVMVPLYLPALAFFAGKMDEHFAAVGFKFLRLALPCVVFASAFYPALRQNGEDLLNSLKRGENRPNPLSEEKAWKVAQNVLEEIGGSAENAGEHSAVIGNNCGLYFCTKLPPFSKYLYQYPLVKIAPEILAEFQGQFEKSHPKLVFVVWPYVTAIPGAKGNFRKLREDYPGVANILLDEGKYRHVHTERGMAEVFVRIAPKGEGKAEPLPPPAGGRFSPNGAQGREIAKQKGSVIDVS